MHKKSQKGNKVS